MQKLNIALLIIYKCITSPNHLRSSILLSLDSSYVLDLKIGQIAHSSVQHSVPLWSYFFLQVCCSTEARVRSVRGNVNRSGSDTGSWWLTVFWQKYDIQHREHRSICGWHCNSMACVDCSIKALNVTQRLRLQIFITSTAMDAMLLT